MLAPQIAWVYEIHCAPVAEIPNWKFDTLGIVSLVGEMVTWKTVSHFLADTVYVGTSARTSPDTSRSISNRAANIIIATIIIVTAI